MLNWNRWWIQHHDHRKLPLVPNFISSTLIIPLPFNFINRTFSLCQQPHEFLTFNRFLSGSLIFAVGLCDRNSLKFSFPYLNLFGFLALHWIAHLVQLSMRIDTSAVLLKTRLDVLECLSRTDLMYILPDLHERIFMKEYHIVLCIDYLHTFMWKLPSYLTGTAFVAVLTFNLQNNISSLVRFEFFLKIRNKSSQSVSGFVSNCSHCRYVYNVWKH